MYILFPRIFYLIIIRVVAKNFFFHKRWYSWENFYEKNRKVFWKIENLMNNSKIFKMRVTTLEINQKKTEKGSYYIIWNKIEGSSQQRWNVTKIKR